MQSTLFFDEIIQDLKREQLLTHADVTLPLSVSELREAADGQLSMFGVGRPSVMDQLAANRPADKKSPAQTFSRKKPRAGNIAGGEQHFGRK